MEIIKNITNSKKDLVKAGNTTLMVKDCVEDVFKMVGAIIYKNDEVDSKTGEVVVKTVCAIKREDGEFISTISPTIEKSLSLILESYDEKEITDGIEVVIKSKKSNAGRNFFYLDIV